MGKAKQGQGAIRILWLGNGDDARSVSEQVEGMELVVFQDLAGLKQGLSSGPVDAVVFWRQGRHDSPDASAPAFPDESTAMAQALAWAGRLQPDALRIGHAEAREQLHGAEAKTHREVDSVAQLSALLDSLGRRVSANPSVVLREEFDDWAVLFDPDTAAAVGVNPVGVAVWHLLDGQRSLAQVTAEIRGRFSDVPNGAIDHVLSYVTSLTERGFARDSAAVEDEMGGK